MADVQNPSAPASSKAKKQTPAELAKAKIDSVVKDAQGSRDIEAEFNRLLSRMRARGELTHEELCDVLGVPETTEASTSDKFEHGKDFDRADLTHAHMAQIISQEDKPEGK